MMINKAMILLVCTLNCSMAAALLYVEINIADNYYNYKLLAVTNYFELLDDVTGINQQIVLDNGEPTIQEIEHV